MTKTEQNGQGALRSNLGGQLEYTSFIPAPLSSVVPLEFDEALVCLLVTCSRKLGALEGMLNPLHYIGQKDVRD